MMNLVHFILLVLHILVVAKNGSAQIELDLNPSTGSLSVALSFNEETRRTRLLKQSVSIVANNGINTLTRATARFENIVAFDLSTESLELDYSSLPLNMQQLSSRFVTGELTINGTYSLAEYETILEAIDYVNTNRNPDDVALRSVVLQVFDDMLTGSNTPVVSININLYNDPPLLYLGGATEEEQNETLSFENPAVNENGHECIHFATNSVIMDPDSNEFRLLCFETETSMELIYHPSSILHIPGTNMYCYNSTVTANRGIATFEFILSELQYCVTSEPTNPVTRTVKAYVEDNGINPPSQSMSVGARATSESAFLFVTFTGATTQPNTLDTTDSTTGATTQPNTLDTTDVTTGATTRPNTLDTTDSTTGTTTQRNRVSTMDSTTVPSTSTPSTSTQAPTDAPMLFCPQENNVPLIPGATLTLLLYNWTETAVGEEQERPCPKVCQELANVPLQGHVTRSCRISDTMDTQAEWTEADFSGCRLSKSALQLCEANQFLFAEPQMPFAEELIETVVNVTKNSSQLETSGVSSATTLLEGLTTAAIEQPEVTESYFQAIDNILNTDPEIILSSQNEANTSARLLQSLIQVTQNVPIVPTDNNTNVTTNATNRVVFALRNFGVVLQDVPVDSFSGEVFSVDLGPVGEAIRMNGSIGEDSLRTALEAVPNATASLSVPSSAKLKSTRLVYSAFLLNSLFIDNASSCENYTIGSIIISVFYNSTFDNSKNESIGVSLQEYREACEEANIPDSAMPTCARYEITDNAVRWTDKGCKFVSSEGGTTRCDCSQPGHFGLIFDIKPGPAFAPLALHIVSFVGAGVSIICLLVMLCTYILFRELRAKTHGKILINICVALIAFYTVFLVAGYVTSVKPLCGVVAGLFQYFLLVYFMWTAVEAVVLCWTVLKAFGMKPGPRFTLIASIIAWVLPLLVVAISAGVGYKYYISDFFCRSFDKPFYYGTLLPVGLLYVFNWIIFLIIIVFRVHQQVSSKDAGQKKRKETKMTVYLAFGLAFLFGLGWGFGLAATTSNSPKVSFAFQLLFSIFIGSQGVLMLVLHGIRPRRVRKQWKNWWTKVHLRCMKKLHPKSPGSGESGFQFNTQKTNRPTAHQNGNGTNLNNEDAIIEQDILSDGFSTQAGYREHAYTSPEWLNGSKPKLCRVDTQLSNLGSESSTSGVSSYGSSSMTRLVEVRHDTL